MKCPTCSSELKRVQYEGFAVFRCMKCHGYLLSAQRLDSIKRINKQSVALLKQEVAQQIAQDTTDKVRCPRCRRLMKKRFVEKPASLHIDTCLNCKMIWLDGGELARLQLAHEISAKGRDAVEMQRRHREMTPQRRQQFEKNIEKLDSGKESTSSIFGQSLLEALVIWLGDIT